MDMPSSMLVNMVAEALPQAVARRPPSASAAEAWNQLPGPPVPGVLKPPALPTPPGPPVPNPLFPKAPGPAAPPLPKPRPPNPAPHSTAELLSSSWPWMRGEEGQGRVDGRLSPARATVRLGDAEASRVADGKLAPRYIRSLSASTRNSPRPEGILIYTYMSTNNSTNLAAALTSTSAQRSRPVSGTRATSVLRVERTETAVPDGAADLVADLYGRLPEACITDTPPRGGRRHPVHRGLRAPITSKRAAGLTIGGQVQ